MAFPNSEDFWSWKITPVYKLQLKENKMYYEKRKDNQFLIYKEDDSLYAKATVQQVPLEFGFSGFKRVWCVWDLEHDNPDLLFTVEVFANGERNTIFASDEFSRDGNEMLEFGELFVCVTGMIEDHYENDLWKTEEEKAESPKSRIMDLVDEVGNKLGEFVLPVGTRWTDIVVNIERGEIKLTAKPEAK